MKHHSSLIRILTDSSDPGAGPCMMGSLTGAVASQSVTEAREGKLRTVGNRPLECKGISLPDCDSDS